jgi:hypothetical protein
MKEVLIAIIAAIPGLLTSIPIIINVISNIRHRDYKTSTLDKVSSIKVLKVIRTGLTDKELNNIESQYKVLIVWFGTFSLLYLLIASFYAIQIIYVDYVPFGFIFEPSLELSIYLSLILTFLYLPIFLVCSYQCIRCYFVFRSINVDQEGDRLLFFEKVQIRLNSDFTQIFNYVRISLVDMQPKSIEFDIDRKVLQANLGSRISHRILNISIQTTEEKIHDLFISYNGLIMNSNYSNSTNLINLINFIGHSFPEALSKISYVETSSDTMNRFINRLILPLNQLETPIIMAVPSAKQKYNNRLAQFIQKRLRTKSNTSRSQKEESESKTTS